MNTEPLNTPAQHAQTYLGWSTGLNIIILYCCTHVLVPAENVNVQQFVYFLLLQLTYKNVHTHNTCIRTRATLASVSTKKSLTTNRIERRTPLIRAKVLKSAEGLRLPATKVDGTKMQKRRSCLIVYAMKILTMRAEPAFMTRSASDLREKTRRGMERWRWRWRWRWRERSSEE